MELHHLTPADYRTSRWSGGETCELLLLPEGASYAERSFALRVSSATVENTHSVFTSLPGVRRFLSPLDGTLHLRHDGGSEITLAPLAVHAFDGGAHTECEGRARDFNLMLRGASGSLRHARGGTQTLAHDGIYGFFLPQGGVCAVNGDAHTLRPFDLLVLSRGAGACVTLPDTDALCFDAAL